jgi:hypothetical protein
MSLISEILRDQVRREGELEQGKATANQQAIDYLVCATIIRPENI